MRGASVRANGPHHLLAFSPPASCATRNPPTLSHACRPPPVRRDRPHIISPRHHLTPDRSRRRGARDLLTAYRVPSYPSRWIRSRRRGACGVVVISHTVRIPSEWTGRVEAERERGSLGGRQRRHRAVRRDAARRARPPSPLLCVCARARARACVCVRVRVCVCVCARVFVLSPPPSPCVNRDATRRTCLAHRCARGAAGSGRN